jgi:hypothetical protein
MKKRWNGELLQGLQELPMETSASIIAGESLFYWMGYGWGQVTKMFASTAPGQSSTQKLVNTALV